MPACDGCKTKKIDRIFTHMKKNNITTGFELIPCSELGRKTDKVTSERLGYCIRRYRKNNPSSLLDGLDVYAKKV